MAFNLRTLFGLLFLLGLSSALKFDLVASSSKNERCIRNFVSDGQLVVVTAIVSGNKGDGQIVNMHVCTIIFLGSFKNWFVEYLTNKAVRIR
jgi:p24 family protein delta-1